ncbi:MAG: HAMP domain-containing histidine kinase, partial [Gammaproteobacteria bacterium]|nr:HAMP domain-containing histidine kinase [Gammaproteobacteria bacterium]
VRMLGAGEFARPIRIHGGSKDLAELGERLDWLRNRLNEQDAAKTAFLRHISHELKTPLTAIREGAALLQDSALRDPARVDPDEQVQIAGIVLDSSVQLQRLIEKLLQLSAASSLPAPPSRKPVALKRIIRRVLGDHHLSLGGKSLQVDEDLQNVQVVGDPELLRIIFDNLFSNAVKYAPPHSRIGIRLHQDGDNAVIDVQDAGPGITPAERDRVFEPFFQGSARSAGAVRGTGLGLAIARDFVKAHHGSIEVIDSTLGAHLRVSIPNSPPAQV